MTPISQIGSGLIGLSARLSALEHTLIVILITSSIVLLLLWIREKRRAAVSFSLWNMSWDIHVCAGLDGFVSAANPSFERVTGWKPSEYLYMPYIDMVHPDDRTRTIDHLQKMQAGSQGLALINRVLCKDGSYKHIEWNAMPDIKQGVSWAVGRDVSHVVQSLEQLESKRRAAEEATSVKSEFLAMMSHEIRTPLNAVVGMCNLMLDTTLSPQQLEYAHVIRNSSDSLLGVINDILDFSRLESRKLDLEFQPFDLHQLMEACLDIVGPASSEQCLDVAVVVEEGTPPVLMGDPMRLRQVIVNVLSNAIKFTAHGHVVTHVSVRKPAAAAAAAVADTSSAVAAAEAPAGNFGDLPLELCFSVTDTGIGIPADRRTQLFQSFSQLDSTRTRKYGGSGLGLAICRALCDMMGGSIDLEPLPEGVEGTRFVFHVRTREPSSDSTTHPADTTDVAAAAAATVVNVAGSGDNALTLATAAAETTALQGTRVLFADPNEHVRNSLVAASRRLGLSAVVVNGAAEALQFLGAGQTSTAEPTRVLGPSTARPRFDVLVLSCTGSDTKSDTTVTAARQLRASEIPCAGLPVVLLSHPLPPQMRSAADGVRRGPWNDAVTDALTSGLAQDVVCKPVKTSQLRRVLIEVLQLRDTVNEALAPIRARLESFGECHDDNTRALRILIAEDVVVNQRIAILQLQKLGYPVPDVANNGLEAVQACERTQYDVVLIDISMPVMDGFEATRQIRARFPRNGPAIVAMTAHAMSDQMHQYLAAGMDACITKPVMLQDLKRVLHDVTTGPKLTDGVTAAVMAPGAEPHDIDIDEVPGAPGLEESPPVAAAAAADSSTSNSPDSVGLSAVAVAAAESLSPPESVSSPPSPSPSTATPGLSAADALAAEADVAAGFEPAISDGDNLQCAIEAGVAVPLFAVFRTSALDSLEAAERALSARLWEDCRRYLHKLKGSGGSMGAMRLFHLIRVFETSNDIPADSAAQMRAVRCEVYRAFRDLQREIDKAEQPARPVEPVRKLGVRS